MEKGLTLPEHLLWGRNYTTCLWASLPQNFYKTLAIWWTSARNHTWIISFNLNYNSEQVISVFKGRRMKEAQKREVKWTVTASPSSSQWLGNVKIWVLIWLASKPRLFHHAQWCPGGFPVSCPAQCRVLPQHLSTNVPLTPGPSISHEKLHSTGPFPLSWNGINFLATFNSLLLMESSKTTQNNSHF